MARFDRNSTLGSWGGRAASAAWCQSSRSPPSGSWIQGSPESSSKAMAPAAKTSVADVAGAPVNCSGAA